VELQSRYADLKKQGLGLIAVSYDSPETLKKFAVSRGITFPMISDAGSAIIKRYGLLNETLDPKTRFYGVPHPGTLMLDRRGVITARYFEDAYQERSTVNSILARQVDPRASPNAVRSETMHLTTQISISDTEVAPGKRVSIVFDVTPKAHMHVYAPGKHSYQVIAVRMDSQPWLKTWPTTYPPSEIFHFKQLDERVETYGKPFRLVQDVTILATQDVQKMLAGVKEITLTGQLEYQACDDKVCYAPAKIPVSFALPLRELDRRPAGGGL
jgi:hypothetical protein